MKVYYNDHEPFVAQWLRNLIQAGHLPAGDVDERSITEVQPDDLRGYDQCHFFAGIGGWAYALQLAGWDRPIWTGSCPCQRFSSATRGRGVAADLWPEWRRLIVACQPRHVAGEQVATARRWFDGVCDDLEAVGYTIGAAVLPACSIGQDHIRNRLYFVGHTNHEGKPKCSNDAEASWLSQHRSEHQTVAGADGVSSRVGRLRAYGNAVIPQVAAEFLMAYMDTEALRGISSGRAD